MNLINIVLAAAGRFANPGGRLKELYDVWNGWGQNDSYFHPKSGGVAHSTCAYADTLGYYRPCGDNRFSHSCALRARVLHFTLAGYWHRLHLLEHGSEEYIQLRTWLVDQAAATVRQRRQASAFV